VAEFRLELNDGLTIGTVEGLTLQGVPQMWCSAGSTTPNAASIVGTSLFLTWGIAPVAGSTFRMPANDLALRGRFGEFLSMATKLTALPIVPPTDNTAVFSLWMGSEMQITDQQEGGQSYVNGLPAFFNTTQGVASLQTTITGSLISVFFPTPLAIADQIDYTADSSKILNPTTGTLATGTWFLP
jgi:hypothetical protein